MKLMLAGATGLVGSHLLRLALDDARVTGVVAPVRRPLSLTHPKLSAPLIDFDAMPADAAWWHADAFACALGTTMKLAGSREAFRRVDFDYPLAMARHAHAHGTRTCVLNSAMGADAGSRFFYNRVKGEVEQALAQVGFDSLTLVRPGLIGGERQQSRPAERVALHAFTAFGPLLPRAWRINPVGHIATAMLEAAIAAAPGRHVVASAALA